MNHRQGDHERHAMTTFCHCREIAAPPADVFAAIADPERLARWWGPDGFSNTFECFEFCEGGQWRFVMHGPDGTNYPNTAIFDDIELGHRVRIRHTCEPHFVLTIELAATNEGTRVDWTQIFTDEDFARRVQHIVAPANEQNLSRLAAEVSRGGSCTFDDSRRS